MRETWVLVADPGRARVYHSDPALTQFELVTAMDHLASRRHASATGSRLDPVDVAHVDFAREVAAYLHERADRYASLVIAAPPGFLGLLRHALTAPVSSRVTRTVNRDFSLAHLEELPALFRAHAA